MNALGRNAESDRLIVSLVTHDNACAHSQMKKPLRAPDHSDTHGFSYTHGAGTRQFENHRSPQQFTQNYRESGMQAVLMHMPDIKLSAVAHQIQGK
jgi:hypothetical protein